MNPETVNQAIEIGKMVFSIIGVFAAAGVAIPASVGKHLPLAKQIFDICAMNWGNAKNAK